MPDELLTSNQLIIKRIRLERMAREAQRQQLKAQLKVIEGGKLKSGESESK
jgi:hypothetical protein